MKKNLFIILIGLFLGVFIPVGSYAYIYSFKVCNRLCYPDVSNVSANYIGPTAVSITAQITDAAGVYSAFVTIKDPSGNIKLQNLTMYDDGSHSDGLANDSQYGITPIDVATWTPGTYTVNIEATDWLGNMGAYNNITNFRVLMPTFIYPLEIVPAIASRGTTVTFMATLKDNNQQAMVNKIIYFYKNDAYLSMQTTNLQGVATFNYSISSGVSAGSHTIKAYYAGDALNKSCFREEILTITADSTTISDFLIDSDPAKNEISVGERIRFSAILRNESGPLRNKTVIFSDQTQSIELCRDNSTESNGYAFCPTPYYTVPLNTTVGTYILRADFDGDSENNPSFAEKTVTVPLKATEISPFNVVSSYPHSVGSPISFSGNLNYDAEDSIIDAMPLPSPQTVLFVDITDPNNIITYPSAIEASGNASGSFDAQWPAGFHTMRAIYSAGDNEHAPFFADRTFIVNGTTAINTFKSYNSSSGEEQVCIRRGGGRSLDLMATLKFLDPASTPVSVASVTFSDLTSGVDLGTGITGASGIAQFNYAITGAVSTGCHNLKANFTDNSSIFALDSYNDSLWVRVVSSTGTCAGKPPCP